MAGNPWAAATGTQSASTGQANPWAKVTTGGTANKLQATAPDIADARIASEKANSPLGLAVQTIKDTGSNLWGAVTDAGSSLLNTYGSVVPQAVEQISAGGQDIAKGGIKNIATGASKAALGTAGGFAGAVYAPIGSAIGAVLKATGGQALFDDTGQKIADTSGITDIPAFQKFAMAHPNAGNYFGQAMNLILGGADDGAILEKSNQTAKAIMDSAGKPLEPNPLVKLPVHGDTTLRKIPVSGDSAETPVIPTNKYTPNEQLPTIEAGTIPKDTSGLPTIQTEAPAVRSDITYTPERTVGAPAAPAVETAPVSPEQIAAPKTVESVANEATAPPRQEPVPVSETPFIKSEVPTKVANDISDKLVKEGFDALTEEQKSTYTSGSYKDSAEQGRILKEQDPEALKQMAITGKDIPAGVHPHILFNIVDELAAETKDYRLQQELAKSPLGTERSQQAAGLGSSGFNKVKESPVDVIRRATKVKQGSDKDVSKVVSEGKKAKATVDKAAVKLINYDKILESLTC